MEWQPIETAPTDTPILGLFKGGAICAGEYVFVEGWGRDPSKDTEDYYDYGESDWECFYLTNPNTGDPDTDLEFSEPTHWMPLPEPPK